jgi:hypothetical protein
LAKVDGYVFTSGTHADTWKHWQRQIQVLEGYAKKGSILCVKGCLVCKVYATPNHITCFELRAVFLANTRAFEGMTIITMISKGERIPA